MFKKFVMALTIAGTLFVSTPKANAGLGIGAIVGNPGAGAAVGAIASGIFAIGISLVITTGQTPKDRLENFGFNMLVLGTPLTIIGTLLDVDAALSHDELELAFQQQYPFIDSHEALSNLALMVKEKFVTEIRKNPESTQTYITLSRDEVEAALETADLSQAQFELIVSDLE